MLTKFIPRPIGNKGKGKGQVLDTALLHDEHMLKSALQSRKWQLIGMIPQRIVRPSIARAREQLDPLGLIPTPNSLFSDAFFRAQNAPNPFSAGAPPRTPLVELTALGWGGDTHTPPSRRLRSQFGASNTVPKFYGRFTGTIVRWLAYCNASQCSDLMSAYRIKAFAHLT